MRILIFHGYPLRGTGSNVYNAELASALARAGHEVHLFCQDHAADELPFVDAVGVWNGDRRLVVEQCDRQRPAGQGRCVAYRPPIGSLLPVYVADKYAHFDARTFDRLSEAELDAYLDANVAAVADVAAAARIEGALANHLVMGPAILARALAAGVPYAVKVHGSAMEYIVRPHPRFLPYAREGLERARAVLVGSRHIARRLTQTVGGERLAGRVFLGPPGVDVHAFAPSPFDRRGTDIESFATELDRRERSGFDARAAAAVDEVFVRAARGEASDLPAELDRVRRGYDPSGIDADAPDVARRLGADRGPIVLYVGKLIASKGVELLLAALPLVAREQPHVRLAIVGFGNFREALELLLRTLEAGDVGLAREIAGQGRALEGGAPDELPQLAAFLDDLDGDELAAYRKACAGLTGRVHWLGRIEHDVLPGLIAVASVQVVPSTFPEAFGMVAAEAAACGVPPVCADHSGLAEVADVLAGGLDAGEAALLRFDPGPGAVRKLAQNTIALLADEPQRMAIAASVAAVARAEFSWEGVANAVLAAIEGRLHSLRVAE